MERSRTAHRFPAADRATGGYSSVGWVWTASAAGRGAEVWLMKIVVLVKHVPDATGERTFAADGTLDREAADGLLSELDEYALQQALRIAD